MTGAVLNLTGNYGITLAENQAGDASTWINNGTIVGTNAQIVLQGDETVAQLGDIQHTGGNLYYLHGTLDNTGGTLDASTTALLDVQINGLTILGACSTCRGWGSRSSPGTTATTP